MGKAKTSRFIRKYGVTLQYLANKYNVSTTYITKLDLTGRLHKFIEESESKKSDKVKSEIRG